MKTNHLYTKILLIFSILNSGLITIHAQTYNFTTTRKNWHVSVDSLSYISPDSLIRNEHLIQIPSNRVVRGTPSNIVNNSETHSHIPTSVTIDTNKDVGEIPFSSNVSPSGAVIYNIPINISTGRNGFQPNISITYNSQGGNDVLGYGWSISGLSTITRIHKNIYYDGKAAPMLLNVNDAFMLDGVRLLPVNNQINTYEPEQGNMRIKANVSGNIINSFIVEYPNGNRGIYSRTNNISFPITHLEDAIGNYITFTYESSNNHNYIKEIKYGGHSLKRTHFATIKFQYKSRTDTITEYQNGIECKLSRLLDNIECYNGELLLHSYTFNYQTENISLLNKIELDKLNPLRFYYGYNNRFAYLQVQKSTLMSYFDTTVPVVVNKGKFNYGSEDDGLIVYPNKSPCLSFFQPSVPGQHSIYYYYSEFHPEQKLLIYQYLNNDFPLPTNLTAEGGFQTLCSADIDGKPGEEILKINNTIVNNQDLVTIKVYKPNFISTVNLTSTFTFTSDAVTHINNKSFWPKVYLPGDYNGDGKIEILAVSMNHPLGKEELNSKCFLFDLSSSQILFNAHVFNFDVANNEIIPMDVNGDGKTDICHVHDRGIDVYSFQNTNNSYSLDKIFTDTDIRNNSGYASLMLGDINEDGKIDILASPRESYSEWGTKMIYVTSLRRCPVCSEEYPNRDICPSCRSTIGYSNNCIICGEHLKSGWCRNHGGLHPIEMNINHHNGTIWTTYLSTGVGLKKSQQDIMEYKKGCHYILQDVNFDGLVDLVERDSVLHVILNENGKFITDKYADINSNSYIIPASVAKANYHSSILGVNGSSLYKVNYTKNETKQRLLTGVINSLGVVQKNYYQQLNDPSIQEGPEIFYIRNFEATFPYESFQGPLWTTSKQETIFNGTILSAFAYNYKNCIMHRQGLGVRGFTNINVFDLHRNRMSNEQIFDPLRFCVPVKGLTPTTESNYTYHVEVKSNKKAIVRPISTSTKDRLKNITKSKSFYYDNYSNLTKEIINYADEKTNNTIQTEIIQTYRNTVSTDSYWIGVPLSKTIIEKRNLDSWMQSEHITYKTGTLLPESQITKINENKSKETRWTYNEYGNILSEKSAHYTNTDFLGSTYTYYDNERYIKTETDDLGRTTNYGPYSKTGQPVLITNFLQKRSIFSYDNMGRLIRVKDANGEIKDIEYKWSSDTGRYYVSEYSNSTAWNITYYDALNREVRMQKPCFDNQSYRNIDIQYDIYGRKEKESLPFNNGVSLWTTYEYDIYDRIIKITQPSGKLISKSYLDNSVTTNQNGITTTQYYDKSGLLTEASDYGETISYEYRADKQLKKVIAPDNVETSFDYDIYGRQTKLVDPSAGTQIYSEAYSNNEKITTQINANNQTITMIFDKFGRIKSKMLPEFNVNYTYDGTTKMLKTETSSNGTSKAYTYDEYGRILTEKDTAPDGIWLERKYTYRFNDISNIVYSTSQENTITTENHIHKNGYLTEIQLGTTSIWKLLNENEIGQPTKVATGPLIRTYGYNNYGTHTERQVGSLQHFTYSFDLQTGNLLNRTDKTRNLTENFGYDNLNRIIHSKDRRVAYSGNGNIHSMGGIGTLRYDHPSKPYVVTQVLTVGNLISLRSQNITYTSFNRPATINENGYEAILTYNASGERAKMRLSQNSIVQSARYYLGDCYETSGDESRLYIGGNAYSAPAVYIKKNNTWDIYYICRDYLGSITHITNSSGNLVQELSYDSWGSLRNPENQKVYTPGNEPKLFIDRGYTGHEHLTTFGLINMNARLYDPALGRFLSPDPYIQMPDFTQSFNRYSYCLNNPLIYKDENGEFIFGYVFGFFKGLGKLVSGNGKWHSPFTEGWKTAKNEMKISWGLFKGDGKQVVSRFTWELPQTLFGLGTSHAKNFMGKVDQVKYFDGATYVISENAGKSNGMTLGSFINMNLKEGYDKSKYEPNGKFTVLNDPMFMHEYGHYIQSQEQGWGYLFSIGIRSIKSANNSTYLKTVYNSFGKGTMLYTHNVYWTETSANKKASKYFKKKYGIDWSGDEYLKYPM